MPLGDVAPATVPSAGRTATAAAAAVVELPAFSDPRGRLVAAEVGSEIPFVPVRAFAVMDVPAQASRAAHANVRCQELLLCLAGACTVSVFDGERTVEHRLDRPTAALYVPVGLWLDLTDFTAGAVLLVLADGPYDPADQVSDRAAYVDWVTRSRPSTT